MSSPDLVPPSQLGRPSGPPPPPQPVSHECDNGWLGTAAAPEPCPICKPHLRRRLQQRRERCQVCMRPMQPSLVESGYRAHPECDDPE